MVKSRAIAALSCLAGLYGPAATVAAASTEARLLPGVCRYYPGAMQTNTGNSFSGDIGLRPVGTGRHIDTQIPKWSGIDSYARMTNPWETLVLYNLTGEGGNTIAGRGIGCLDEDGIIVVSGQRQPIKINTAIEGTLVLNGSYGLTPEPYAYYVDGVRQPGVYLGVAGSVDWAWGLVNNTPPTGRSLSYWIPRLLVPTDTDPEPKLKDNEVRGFLVALFP